MASRSSDGKTLYLANTNHVRIIRAHKPLKQPATDSTGWTPKNLRPYSKFSKLYGERKFARAFPKQNISFLDLPAEIRNEIYRHALCFGSIELSAKASDGKANHEAVKHHREIYKYHITPTLRILRLNKQTNRETATIFYGDNEFRFSSMHGHDMLFAFYRTIGKRNTGLLRKIVEHCPHYGDYSTSVGYLDRPAKASASGLRGFQRLLEKLGLRGTGYGAGKFDIPRMLTRANGGIEEYTLVIPDTFNLRHAEDVTKYDRSRTLLPGLLEKNPDAAITVAKLRTADETEWGHWVVSQEQADLREAIDDQAVLRGWTVMEVEYDPFGCYSLKFLGGVHLTSPAKAADL